MNAQSDPDPSFLVWRHVYLFLLLLFTFPVLHAQQHNFTRYTIQDGLPTNYVYGVVEDDSGYIWAYTENGLAKFDGYSFSHLSTQDGLPGNDVVQAVKDENGKVWLWLFKNPPAYIQDGRIHQTDRTSHALIPRIFDGRIHYITAEDLLYEKEGSLHQKNRWRLDSSFYAQESALFQLDSVGVHQPARGFFGLSGDSVSYLSLQETIVRKSFEDGYLYYLPHNNKVYWKKGKQRNSFESEHPFMLDRGRGRPRVTQFRGTHCYVLHNSYNDLLFIDIDNNCTWLVSHDAMGIDASLEQGSISMLDSTVILSTREGFVELDESGRIIDRMDLPDLGQSYQLHRSFKDSHGNIWIGSREGGLFFFPARARQATRLQVSREDQVFEQLVATASGRLIAITDNLGIYAVEGEELTCIQEPDKSLQLQAAISTSHGIIIMANRYAFLLEEKDGNVQINPYQDRFDFHLSKAHLSNPQEIIGNLRNRQALSYHEAEDRLYSARMNSDLLIQHSYLPERKVEITWRAMKSTSILYVHPENQLLYLVNEEGLHVMKDNQTLLLIDSLPNITTLYGTKDRLWIGTESEGLYVYVYDLNRSGLWEVSDAWRIRQIRPDSDSTLLVASNEGILIISQSDRPKELTRYDRLDGLEINEVLDVYAAEDRYLYAASIAGLHRIDRKAEIPMSFHDGDLWITGVRDKPEDIHSAASLEFSYSQNNLEFSYHCMSYASQGEISYFTKLEPISDTWHESKGRDISYLSLDPGSYRFHLKARDMYGQEIAIDPVLLTIKGALWQTIWFRVSIVMALTMLMFGWGKYVTYLADERTKKEQALNRRMASLNLAALKAQMNPHFLSNAMTAIQYFVHSHETDSAEAYLARFARLMRLFLLSSKEAMIPLAQEIEMLRTYTDLEQLRFEDRFSVALCTEDELEVDDLMIPSMFLQPFVENAIEHGLAGRTDGKGELRILFWKEDKHLMVHISDNGIGRAQAQQRRKKAYTSSAMQIIEEKAETLRQGGIADVSYTIDDLNPADTQYPGTLIIVTIKHKEYESL